LKKYFVLSDCLAKSWNKPEGTQKPLLGSWFVGKVQALNLFTVRHSTEISHFWMTFSEFTKISTKTFVHRSLAKRRTCLEKDTRFTLKDKVSNGHHEKYEKNKCFRQWPEIWKKSPRKSVK
jgi:hypothetical protein